MSSAPHRAQARRRQFGCWKRLLIRAQGRLCFISYNHGDYDFAEALDRALEDRGVWPWRDDHETGAGSIVREEINFALKRWPCFARVVSQRSKDAKWVDYETKVAASNGAFLVPVILDDTEPPPEMLEPLYVNVQKVLTVEGTHRAADVAATEIAKTLSRSSFKRHLGRQRRRRALPWILMTMFVVAVMSGLGTLVYRSAAHCHHQNTVNREQMVRHQPRKTECPVSDAKGRAAVKLPDRAYWIQRNEVALWQYAAFAAATDRAFERGQGPAHTLQPVTGVTFDDATTYCRWIGARLPTMAEWTHAAAGDMCRRYPWGNEAPKKGLVAMDFDGKSRLQEVSNPGGDLTPAGVMHLGGNVSEWVVGVRSKQGRSVMGGSYLINGAISPGWASPFRRDGLRNPARGYPDVGFRCAADAASPPPMFCCPGGPPRQTEDPGS